MSHQKSSPALRTRGMEKNVWVEFIDMAIDFGPLDLGAGCPDFAPPQNIRQSLAECATNDKNLSLLQHTKSFGHPRLVNAIATMYSKFLHRELDARNEILVTAGAYEALNATITGLVNPGDEVIIIEPFFDCYEPQTRLAGGIPIFVPLRPKKTDGEISSADWLLDPEELSAAFNDKTKLIIVNTPNNPIGKVFTLEELTTIADLCMKYDTIAIMDEVYEHMTYAGIEHIRMANIPGMYERCLTICSAAKSFSVTGFRIGWAIGPETLLRGPKIIHTYTVAVCATPLQEAIAVAMEEETGRLGKDDCYFNSLTAALEVKRDRFAKMFKRAGLNPVIPEGGYFMLTDVRNIASKIDIGGDPDEKKDFRFAKWLCRNRKLLAIPPSAFFSEEHKSIGENYLRFCFIKEDCNLDKAGDILLQLKADIDSGKLS